MLHGLWVNLINIIYPAQFTICNKAVSPEIILCQDCTKAIELNVAPFCAHCGRSLSNYVCQNCKKLIFHFDRVWSACRYKNIAATLIHLFKYKGKHKIKNTLIKVITNFIKESHIPMHTIDIITPIPLHHSKLRERGFNQSCLLSEDLAGAFNITHSAKNLIRIKNQNTQTKLNVNSRFKNIEGAFKIKDSESFKNKNVLLIDDVLTTGATTSEASRILKKAGAKKVFVLTFAN